MTKKKTINDLIDVMARLRDPDSGCPWDLEQNFKSIAPYTLEEAYEVADAIENEDFTALREELGDLLLQPIYHAQMAKEARHFDIHDVIHDITEKMIHRHPHVFSDNVAKNPDDVNKIWDERKKQEKAGNKQSSAIDDVPLALPALIRAQKLQKKAAKTGFEWQKAEDILEKLDEEISEMKEALQSDNIEHFAEELGDVFFMLTRLARHKKLNAETIMRNANTKFERRFKGMEEDFKKSGKKLESASSDQMTRIWQEQKKKEI